MTDFKRTTPKGASIKYNDTASTKRMLPKGEQVSVVAAAGVTTSPYYAYNQMMRG